MRLLPGGAALTRPTKPVGPASEAPLGKGLGKYRHQIGRKQCQVRRTVEHVGAPGGK